MKKNLSSLAILALVASAGALNAQTLLNGDFSSPSIGAAPAQQYTTAAPDDFTATVAADQSNGQIGLISSTSGFTGGLVYPTGTSQVEYQSAGATTASADVATSVGLYQEVGALKADTTYTFTVGEALATAYRGNATFELGLYTASSPTTSLALQTLQNYTDTVSSTSDFNQFQYESVTFTTGATPTGYLTVALSLAPSSAGTTAQGYFANATLTAIPEPATYALLGLGALALMIVNRRMAFKS